jgi:23S rRNA pseudouridine1911/1915/1917 synthase
MEIRIETGRTHQIRVHFSHMNHPLVGDRKYGSNRKLNDRLGLHRQWLHAVYLEFNHPFTGNRIGFHSSYPQDLQDSLSLLSSNK